LSACATVRGAARIFLRERKPEIIVKAYTLKTAESTKNEILRYLVMQANR